jgi:malate dehydrogenase
MRDVAIIGAGELGGSLAHVLARRNSASGVRLIDQTAGIAEGKALDIAQAAPIESFSTRLDGSTDISAVAGAAIVVIADRAGAGEFEGEEGLALVRRVAQFARGAIVLAAGSQQGDLVDRGVRELGLSRLRMIGSAPEAFAAAARALVALEANASPRDVALVALGNPPRHVVISWEEATIGGFTATSILDEPARRRISARLTALWPPGPYALAMAAAKVVDALAGRTRQTACCFVAPDDTEGRRSRTAALPVVLGPEGVERVVLPRLNAHDRVILENALML